MNVRTARSWRVTAPMWAWPDGEMHLGPPAPVPLVYDPSPHGFWRPTCGPSCGATFEVPAEGTSGAYRVRCDRRRGHPPEAGCDDDHRAVIDRKGGADYQWGDA